MNSSIIINNISLHLYQDENLTAFTEMFTNYDLCKFMAGGAYDKDSEAEKLFNFFQKSSVAENSTKKAYGIFIEDELIGHFETSKKDDEIEIAYLLIKAYWGKGIMNTIITHFNNSFTETIVARVLPNNTNSTKMLEKLSIKSKTLSKFDGQTVLKYALANKMEKDYKNHWNTAYQKTEKVKLGWFEQHAEPSLKLIESTKISKDARILNVGAGRTSLINDLVKQGYSNIIVNDISAIALKNLKEETKNSNVEFIEDDLTNPKKLQHIEKVDLWNDRAVLHFFNDKEEINTYFKLLKQLVNKNGFVILSEFAINGAAKCCGLDVKRYNLEMYSNLLGSDFETIEYFYYDFYNPNGDLRKYIYALFKRVK